MFTNSENFTNIATSTLPHPKAHPPENMMEAAPVSHKYQV